MDDTTTDRPAAASRLRYRLLTGAGDRAFCERISEALDEGYELYGDPALTYDGQGVVSAQAVVLPAGAGTGGGAR